MKIKEVVTEFKDWQNIQNIHWPDATRKPATTPKKHGDKGTTTV